MKLFPWIGTSTGGIQETLFRVFRHIRIFEYCPESSFLEENNYILIKHNLCPDYHLSTTSINRVQKPQNRQSLGGKAIYPLVDFRANGYEVYLFHGELRAYANLA